MYTTLLLIYLKRFTEYTSKHFILSNVIIEIIICLSIGTDKSYLYFDSYNIVFKIIICNLLR